MLAVGSKISLSEIAIHNLVADYFDDLAGAAAAASKSPKVTASVQAVATAGAAYFASRPVTKI